MYVELEHKHYVEYISKAACLTAAAATRTHKGGVCFHVTLKVCWAPEQCEDRTPHGRVHSAINGDTATTYIM